MKPIQFYFLRFLFSTLLICILFTSLGACNQECRHARQTENELRPSCDTEGSVIHTCVDCGFEYATDIVPPHGHNLHATVFEATCDLQGYTTFSCLDCGYTYSADQTTPLGHALTPTTIAPTCTEQGYTEHRCNRCDYIFTDESVAPSHSFQESVVPVTCTHSGYTKYQCEDCTYSYKHYIHYTDLLPHAYTENDVILAKGLDVSRYNHKTDSEGNYLPLDWNAIKSSGFDYVILKVGSTPRNNGTAGGKEVTFEMDYEGAKAAGLGVGVYFFTYAKSVEQNIADADMVADWLKGKQLEYPVYYDIENASFDDDLTDSILPELPDRKTLTDYCIAFISRMQEKGFYCGLYCNHDWLYNRLETGKCVALFDIWFARYHDTSTSYTSSEVFVWSYGDPLGMWQYACTGTIDGFPNTYFDFNYTYKDFPSIIKAWHLNGY